MLSVPAWDEASDVQPSPSMHARAAEQTQESIRLVLPVRPQLCDTGGEF